jgi:hypothetical protein
MANDTTKNLGDFGGLVSVSGTTATYAGLLQAITPSTGDNSTNLATTAYAQTLAGAGFLGTPWMYRNFLINGGFMFWNRGTSFVNPAAAYTADRWMATGVAANIAQGTSSAVITATSATNSFLLTQALEALMVQPLAGQTVTFSFTYVSSVAQPSNSLTLSVSKNSTANTQTGGTWTSLSGTGATTLTPTTTPQRATFTCTIPSDGSAAGVRVVMALANITNASTVTISQIQLELGSVATAFEFRPPAAELAMCMRYLPFIASYSTASDVSPAYVFSTTAAVATVPFAVPARVAPTGITVSSATHFTVHTAGVIAAASAATFNSASQYMGSVGLTVSGFIAGQGGRAYFNNLSGLLLFTGCELSG